MTDWTKLIDRLEPPRQGETPVLHRTGIVSVINGDGTVDLTLGGETVEDVAVLDGAVTTVGEPVQVLVWKGDLLVLGQVRTAP